MLSQLLSSGRATSKWKSIPLVPENDKETGLVSVVIALRKKVEESMNKVFMREEERDDTFDDVGDVSGAKRGG